MIQEYLHSEHKDEILQILKASDRSEIPFRGLKVDLSVLKAKNVELFTKLTRHDKFWSQRMKWIAALDIVQEHLIKELANTSRLNYSVKNDFPVSFWNHVDFDYKYRPHNNLWKFVQVKAKVSRTRERGKQELIREYKCRKCKTKIMAQADRLTRFHFNEPKKCTTHGCKGVPFHIEDSDNPNLNYFIGYQEIKVQPFDLPEELVVELEDELVESCFAGDQITICGSYETRSKKDDADSHVLVMRAASIVVHDNQQKIACDLQGALFLVADEWRTDLEKYNDNELILRDEMARSIAPELGGLAIVKLGLLLTLVSGGSNEKKEPSQGRSSIREISHFLMIGDPGVGKSQLLKAAASISTNSVRTVGYNATTAGLTATCYKEDGYNQIEAGILVKANNGICCIDELNLLTKEHRGAIHEVMESQKITLAKAGCMAELNAKCSIIAGMNQRNSTMPIDAKNISIEGSLLSRFDLIYELEDLRDPDFDMSIIDLILNGRASTLDDNFSPWTLERLKMHVMVAKDLQVVITSQALQILQQYYLFCTRNTDIDMSRKTIRLYNSLERLTLCHAKLMMRMEASFVDAIAVVMLMESSWSFGHLIRPQNVMKSSVPLGPSQEYILEVLEKLNLEAILDECVQQLNPPKLKSNEASQSSHEITCENLDDIFADLDGYQERFEAASSAQTASQSSGASKTSLFLSVSSKSLSQKTEDEFSDGEISFRSPPTTSTQLNTSGAFEKRKASEAKIPPVPQKKRKQEGTSDASMRDNLNALAALFAPSANANNTTPELVADITETRPTTSTARSSAIVQVKSFAKFKKFEFDDSEQQNLPAIDPTPDENAPNGNFAQLSKMTEEEQRAYAELDDFFD